MTPQGGETTAGTIEHSWMGDFETVALANKDYIAEQYRRYRSDPASVDERWALFFACLLYTSDAADEL